MYQKITSAFGNLGRNDPVCTISNPHNHEWKIWRLQYLKWKYNGKMFQTSTANADGQYENLTDKLVSGNVNDDSFYNTPVVDIILRMTRLIH
jgi:hypothetical protein